MVCGTYEYQITPMIMHAELQGRALKSGRKERGDRDVDVVCGAASKRDENGCRLILFDVTFFTFFANIRDTPACCFFTKKTLFENFYFLQTTLCCVPD